MKPRNCRKCQALIPNRMQIDGKEHILRNRKFCLKCSPFKQWNRSSIEPFAIKPKANWKTYSPRQKEQVKKCLYRRAYERKLKIIKIKGGCCELCKYNKSLRALSFHHRDPKTKLFGLSLNNLWSKDEQSILDEANKCSLLCLNCHAELEEKISNEKSSLVLQEVKQAFKLTGGPVG